MVWLHVNHTFAHSYDLLHKVFMTFTSQVSLLFNLKCHLPISRHMKSQGVCFLLTIVLSQTIIHVNGL